MRRLLFPDPQSSSLFAALVPLLSLGLGLVTTARADDWPQWMGPRRDGVWREAGLVEKFPEGGPPVRWRTPTGSGYAGPAVAAGRVYLMDRVLKPDVARPANAFARVTVPGSERVLCLNESDGKVLWTYEYDCPYSLSYGAGPRTTPAVDGKLLYTLGAEGNLSCLEADTGKLAWGKKLSGEKQPTPMWGFAGHPLVDGDKVLCTTGDPHGVLAAFDKHTGNVLWTALSATEPGYSPPVIYEAAGRRQLIQWDPESVNSLDPETGKIYWSVKHGPLKMGLCIITPRLYHDEQLGDLLFVSTQYQGALMLKLGKTEQGEPTASVLWKRVGKNDKHTDALHILISTPVMRAGYLYGVDCMGPLRCLDVKTGDRLWETTAATTYDAGPQSWSTAFLVPLGDAGDRYLLPNEHGDVILADLSPRGYHEVSRAHLIEPANLDPGRPVVWSAPAFADKCIFWRNDKEIVCASLATK